MKNLWDDRHPEYSHFTDKNLRQQASYIQKRGYIRETQNKDNNDLENRNDPERPTTIIEERIDNGNCNNNMLEIRTPPHVKNTVETINNKKLYNTLRKRFVENFEIYQSINTERMEFTTTRKKPNGEELLLTNTIATEYFSKIKIERDITYKDINCPVYSTAVTLKLHLNDVNKRTVRSDNKQSEPKWMTQPTEKNKRIRKNLPHIELVQKCKQKKILHRLRRKYGNTKHQTLIYHAELLKYELKATSTRLTYQKKTLEQK